jgi:hypothetical protein
MPRQHRTRYDTFDVPSEPELLEMYRKEGLTDVEAIKKAKEIHDFFNYAVKKEAQFWRKVRDNEYAVGLDVEQYLEGEDKYAT